MKTGAWLAGVLLLAGCGDDAPEIQSAQDVADRIGCTDLTADSEEMFVTEGGACDLGGEVVNVYYFADNQARDNYVDFAAGFGGQYLVGENYAIDAAPATLADLQDEIGGDIQP